MLKMSLILFLIIITTMIGNKAADKLKNRVNKLKLILLMLSEIEIMIKYKSATVFEIISELNKKICFKELQFLKTSEVFCKNQDRSFEEIWEKAVLSDNCSEFNEEDKKLISSIGQQLGKCELDGQLSAIALLKTETENLISEADKIYNEKGKMYRYLGVLTGAFISIIVI